VTSPNRLPAAGEPCRVPAEPCGSVTWGAGPLRFELTSGDPAVLALARAVFRPWSVQPGAAPPLRWRVDRAGDDRHGGWRVRPPHGPEFRAASVGRAVAAVEFGAVTACLDADVVAVHGALIGWGGDGALIVGRGEAGKSTLACALLERGASLLGDDVALVEPGSTEACSAPRRVQIRDSSRELVSADLLARAAAAPGSSRAAGAWLFHPDDVVPQARPRAVRLRSLVFLARLGADAPPGRAVPLAPAHALLALLPYTNLRSAASPGAAIRALVPLVTQVPACDLGRGPIQDMAAAVESRARLAPPA
jgi:hypothetical protein